MNVDTPIAADFIEARWFTHGPRTKGPVIWVVLHDMEAPEAKGTARNVARYFQSTDRKASAHYNVDRDEVIQCVHEVDIAYQAIGANAQGIGIEHAGYGSQSARDWDDDYSHRMLRLSARLVADICTRHKVPVTFVKADGLQHHTPGITSHNEVSHAFPGSGHTDPGPNFPFTRYIEDVARMVKHPWPGRVLKLSTPHLNGADVRQVQERLVRHNFAAPQTGDFDQATKDSLKRFQTAKKLTVDGEVGWVSWDELWKHPGAA